MTTNQAIPEQIQAIRTATIELIDAMEARAEVLQVPEPPKLLEESRRRLTANSFQVLVVGEAKRGKSSFVNALIGRTLLPTDVDVATSQVFRVRNAEREAYRVRFEDDSSLEIQITDLPRYGSQVLADSIGLPNLKEIIRWVEIDVPAHFLPSGVSILDTPGLGSLYSGHAQITHRFVPLADAVIFVVDSLRPIIQAEVDFINTLLDFTSNILFVQTKIDKQRVTDWQAIQQRNQDILREQFGSRLPDTRVWPVSSTHLLRAGESDNEDSEEFLELSHFSTLAAVLQVFLFRAAGWERSASAIQAAEDYFLTTRKSLTSQFMQVTEASEQQRAELQLRIAEREQAFEHEWGMYGQEKIALLEQVRQIIITNQRSFLSLLQRNNDLEIRERNSIESLPSIQEASNYNSRMADRVVGVFLDAWREVCQKSRDEILVLLTRFLVASDALDFTEDPHLASLIVTEAPELVLVNASAMVKEKILAEANMITYVAKILGQFLDDGELQYDTETGQVTGLGFIEGLARLATMCYVAIRGQTLSNRVQLEDAKKQLHRYLDEILHAMRAQFQDNQLGVGGQNRVESFFSTLEQRVATQMQQICEQKTKETKEELARIATLAQLSEQERDEKGEQLRQQLATWNTFAASLKTLKQNLQDMDRLLNPFMQVGS